MRNNIHKIGSFAFFLWCFATICFAAPGKDNAKSEEMRHAKARYYYVEGSVALAEGRSSDAYELIKKAASIDPEYSEAAYNFALLRMGMRNDTLQSSAEVRRSISMMRPFVDKYPGESSEAMNYSFLAARSGDMDEAIRVAERTDSLAPDLTGTLLQLTQYYTIKNDVDKALKTIERYERIEGVSPDLSLRKFSLLLNKGDTVGLLGESKRLIDENPVNPDFMIIRGNVFEVLEMPDSALLCYQRAERMDPDNGRTKLTLAEYYLGVGDSAAYDLKSREAMLSDDIMLEEKLQMMTRYMQNILADSADTSRGTRLFEGLLQQYPHEPTLLDLGAQYFATINNMPRAEELMEYATDLEPENPDYWVRLATFYYADDKYGKSVSVAEKGMNKLKETPRGLLTVYGASALLNNEYDKAWSAYQRQLEMDLPGVQLTDSLDFVLKKVTNLDYDALMRVANIFAMAGDCLSKKDDIKGAIREYEVSLAINPSNPMSANNYAYFQAIGGGDLDKAEEYSRKAIEQSPDNPTYLDTLAWILFLKGKYPEALEIQEKVIDKVGDNDDSMGEYWDHYGDMLYKMNQKDKAVESWKKAKELGSDNKQLSDKIRTKRLE